ncbi:MAG: hypothetical protein AAF399_27690 [Bacteroidota bacterium]
MKTYSETQSSTKAAATHSQQEASTDEAAGSTLIPPALQFSQATTPPIQRVDDEEEDFEPSGRSSHQWRTALLGARNQMVGRMMDAKQEFFQRHTEAMNQFERTMDFASEKSAAGLILKAEMNQLLGQLPAPLNTVVTQVTIVADAYQQAGAASAAVNLDTWIEQKRNALQTMREMTIDPDTWPQITAINTRIESLVADTSTEAERERQQWELNMLNPSFDVGPTAQEIEFALYDEWCYKKGAFFVSHTYQTDRHYPGYQEIGRTDQSHAAFGGEQRWARNVPSQILDRLQRLGLRPERTLNLPSETVAHDRVSEGRGGLNPQYREGDTTRHMPYTGDRAENWTGPERFRE